MKIVIVGDGKVGFALTQELSREKHDIVVIDRNMEALRNPSDMLDVIAIQGNGASYAVQMEAGVAEADLLIAATSADEINMLCCLLAKKLGAKNTIARVRNPEYSEQLMLMRDELGLSMSVNPELAAAREISRMLRFPSAIKIDTFARGRVELVEMRLREDCPLIGHPLSRLQSITKTRVLVCAVQRGEQVWIPSGDFVLHAQDRINVTGAPVEIAAFSRAIGANAQKVHRVMIVGGGRVAYYLAKQLLDMHMEVRIIERNRARCEELTEMLPQALIIQGDGTDQDLLHEEGLGTVDAFVALTGMDEENILLALYANRHVPKVVAKVDRITFLDVMGNVGVECVVSPKALTTNQIVRYVRALQNSEASNNVETLYKLVHDQVEALEFRVREKAPYLGKTLKELNLKTSLLIGCIVRGRELIIPSGNDTLEIGDSVIVVTTNCHLQDLGDILA